MLFSVDTLIAQLMGALYAHDEPKVESDPFPHLVLDDVFPVEFVHGLAREIDGMRTWFRYDSPLEKKSTSNRWDEFGPYLYSYFTAMLSEDATREIANKFGINRLVPDIGLHGGGVHVSNNGDKLNVHQDYSIHPKVGLERRINVIFHVEPMWQPYFGGHLELWSGGDQPEHMRRRIISTFNRMIVFATSPGSWHGFPEPIDGVDLIRRKSLATYYLSELTDDAVERYRARYAPTDAQKEDEHVLALIRERSAKP
jgi:hypothetical protein